MKRINHLEMNSASDVMDKIMGGANLKAGMKKSTLFKFWGKIAGKKFEKYSQIDTLTERGGVWVLGVACKNAQVTGELTMFKAQLLKKVNIYANPLGLEISDIHFSHKIWKGEFNEASTHGSGMKALDVNPYTPDLSGFNPEAVELDEAEIESVKQSVESNTFATKEQRERMFRAIILDLKTQKYINDKP